MKIDWEWVGRVHSVRQMWFTADTHFGHRRMVESREFVSADEMDEAMIKSWNSVVNPQDLVYHLGDFSFRKKEETLMILKRLNGKIHLVKGNHDKIIKNVEVSTKFVWVKDYFNLKVNKEKIILCHFPFETWDKSHYGSWHLHGHSHGSLITTRDIKRFDVGVDTNNLIPYHLEEITEIMAKRGYEAVDHHTSNI